MYLIDNIIFYKIINFIKFKKQTTNKLLVAIWAYKS